ncbi:MAG TPA: GAF domain-containing protein, partial [Firmicutes bacterium]|nr:GAF domain-containing protein [Bacillota bacterium]
MFDSGVKKDKLDKEQFFKDKISYLEKENLYLKGILKNYSKLELASIFLNPESFDKINKVVGTLLREKDLDIIYRSIVLSIKSIFGFNRVGLMLIDNENNLCHKVGYGLPKHYTTSLKIPIRKVPGISMRATAIRSVLERRPVIIADRSNDSEYNLRKKQTLKKFSHQFLMVPLIGRKKVWGVLTVATSEKEKNFLTENTLEMLKFYVNQATLAVENYYYNKEQEEATEKIKKYSIELEKSNKHKDEFLNNISHELRTPLTPIIGFTDLLLSDPEISDAKKEILGMILNSSTRLFYLIEDLMDLSRISQGKLVFNFEVVNLVSVINSVIETLLQNALKKQIIISFKKGRKKYFSELDPNRTIQVLWNILSNAIKFSPQGSVIEISLKQYNVNNLISVK